MARIALILGPLPLLACALAACATATNDAATRRGPSAGPTTRADDTRVAAPLSPQQQTVTPGAAAARRPPPPPNPEVVARARQLTKQGLEYYRDGDYDHAEAMLKEAIVVYPFMADANMTLGRIFLIRGSASRDRALITSARTMFEMARAIDPSLREVQVLLDLFREAPPE